jgi:microcystin-dependent protein
LANKNFIVKNDIELKGNLIFEGATKDSYETTLAITDPTADITITFPNSTGTVALTANKLSAFASTTSAELAGVISDETGTGGVAVFSSGPTLTGTTTVTNLTATTSYDTGIPEDQVTAYAHTPTGMISAFAGANAPTGWLLCDGTAVSRTTYSSLFAVTSTTYGTGDGSTTFNLPDLRQRIPVGSSTPTSVGTVTMTIATPAVFTRTAHGLATGQIVYFTTTGALPTGLTATFRYWVIALTANTFRLATSLSNANAGTAIATSGTQSGTHTLFSADFELGASNGSAQHVLTTTEIPSHAHTATAAPDTHDHTFTYTDTAGNVGDSSSPRWDSSNESADATRTVNTLSDDSHTHTITVAANGGGLAHNNLQPYVALNYIIKT